MKLYHFAYLKRVALDELDFAFMARVHTLPRAFIEWRQGRELRRLVSSAYERFPVYRDLWRERGARPEDIRSVNDIRSLPISSKRMFKQSPPEALLGDPPPRPNLYAWKETSGSTGEPFRFPVRAHGLLPDHRRSFYEYRFLLWRGNPLCHIVDRLKSARIDEEPARHEFSLTREELRRDPTGACQALRKFGADVLRGTPTSLFELAEYAARLPEAHRPRPRFIVSASEVLTSAVREHLADTLMGELYNSYGLEEVGGVGIECRMHDGFHIHEESILVEIVDEDGRALPPGTAGRVIVTCFNENQILPFIRYDTGDRGMILAAACPCGLSARRLSIDGRNGGFLTIGSKRFHNFEFEFAMNLFHAHVLRYQLAKQGPERVEIRVIPTRGFSPVIAEDIRKSFQEKFGIAPRITVVHSLPATPAGKTPTVIDETEQ